eukprot:TRINITY_DN2683_c0_g1_i1.p1 TRINITY_DN2683_c0_g1~~TRINITY_DN2683_c0_g1_i1.p1  ORF type:complete len:107 (-),score=17.32 TRINITY_DN2683_c0_g1_i1:1008-1328(-)
MASLLTSVTRRVSSIRQTASHYLFRNQTPRAYASVAAPLRSEALRKISSNASPLVGRALKYTGYASLTATMVFFSTVPARCESVYDFKARDIDRQEIDLKKFEGKV